MKKPTLWISSREAKDLKDQGLWENLERSYELVVTQRVNKIAEFIFPSEEQTED